MEEGDRIPPEAEVIPAREPNPQPKALQPGPLRRATDFLVSRERITTQRSHYTAYRRYALLNVQDMYNSLVSMYSGILQSYWHRLRTFMEAYPAPAGTNAHTHAARAYISAWFIDLYVANRDAVRKTSSIAFNQRFYEELLPVLTEYDHFLATLNASIRPTRVMNIPEDTLYIPYLIDFFDIDDLDEDNLNPFGINNFTHNPGLSVGLVELLKDSKILKFTEMPTNTVGRPCWLFDWHDTHKVCAWFPMEGNFSLDDVALAYIVGVACTPKLGPRDVDDWQIVPGVIPQNLQPNNYQRAVARRWYGAFEVTTIEGDTIEAEASTALITGQDPRAAKTRKTARGKKVASSSTEPADDSQAEEVSQEPEGPRYKVRLTDWTYYYTLVLNFEQHTRTGALRKMIFEEV